MIFDEILIEISILLYKLSVKIIMNQLLGQLSQFINTVMELYPLPY